MKIREYFFIIIQDCYSFRNDPRMYLNNVTIIEKVNALFLKAAYAVSKYTPSPLTYELVSILYWQKRIAKTNEIILHVNRNYNYPLTCSSSYFSISFSFE